MRFKLAVFALASLVAAEAAALSCPDYDGEDHWSGQRPVQVLSSDGFLPLGVQSIPLALKSPDAPVRFFDDAAPGAEAVAGALSFPAERGDVALWRPLRPLDEGAYGVVAARPQDVDYFSVSADARSTPVTPSLITIQWERAQHYPEDSFVCCDTDAIYQKEEWDCFFDYMSGAPDRPAPGDTSVIASAGSYYTVDRIERGTIYYDQRCSPTLAQGAARWSVRASEQHPYVGYRITVGDQRPFTARWYHAPQGSGVITNDVGEWCVSVEQYDLRTGRPLDGVEITRSCATFDRGQPLGPPVVSERDRSQRCEALEPARPDDDTALIAGGCAVSGAAPAAPPLCSLLALAALRRRRRRR